ncbi:uncharacterized protein N7500_010611 [Penicillium coprophilum]|uniref:uncharacterized protein n=1 Tax=Penicillium coprophilum TaxID=36646 RepID=UPI002388E38D|nr:uncharacterized protein N7500_010611 [Penicillium coprophilum]KAJ5150422.1 hypothetical protein N7500_010611 [Penicillium coprophilum]
MENRKDLLPDFIQLRETNDTPSVHESEDSLETRENQSPTPRARLVEPVTSLTGGNHSESEPPVPVSNSQTLSDSSSSPSYPGSPRRNTQAPSTPVRPIRVRYSLRSSSQKYLPAARATASSGNTPASIITRKRQSIDTTSANAKGPPKDVIPTTTPRPKLVVKKPHDASTDSRTDSNSATANKYPTDVASTTPRLRLVLKRPREATPDSGPGSDFANENKHTNSATPTVTRRIKLIVNSRSRQSTLDSIPSTVPPDPVSNDYSSSFANSGEQPSNINSDQLKHTKKTSVDTSHGSSSDYDEASTNINPTSELPAPSASSKSPSSSGEAPFGYSGYRSPLRDLVFSTPPDPSTNPPMDPELDSSMDASMDPYMDPHQPDYSGVVLGITPFEDPNVIPSAFMYPEEATGSGNRTIDPMGVYTPEEFERIIASEQELLREMADPHADPPHVAAWEDQRRVERYINLNGLAADMKAAVKEMEAEHADDETLQPGYWNSISLSKLYPTEPDAPDSSLLERPPALFKFDEPAHIEPSSTQQAASADLREPSEVSSQTLQSVEVYPDSAAKRVRHISPKTKSSTSEKSTTASARTSASVQRRSASSRVKTPTPSSTSTTTRRRSKDQPVTPVPTSTSFRRRSRTSMKTELDTSEPPVTVSPRRLRSSGVKPSPSTKKMGKGSATPDSWETAPVADKMMSQMKETKMSWMEITTTWNNNRPAEDDIMTSRALSKRWGRIKESIGAWPVFDIDSEPDDNGFLQIADFITAELGWDVSATACKNRYKSLKESGEINLKSKGRARK